jgi:nicotinate-nucleotide adenylyltransferase
LTPDFGRPTILFGGSFDPVHAGHLHVARECLLALPEMRQLTFVPAAESPGRTARASAEQRFAWLRLAAEPQGFRVWDFEVTKAGPSFTVNTLEAAHLAGARVDQLYWLLGADAYAGFARWKAPERIRELCRILVVDRPGHESASQHPLDRFICIPPHPASSTAIRHALEAGNPSPAWLPGAIAGALGNLLPGQNPYVKI